MPNLAVGVRSRGLTGQVSDVGPSQPCGEGKGVGKLSSARFRASSPKRPHLAIGGFGPYEVTSTLGLELGFQVSTTATFPLISPSNTMYHLAKGLYLYATSKEGARLSLLLPQSHSL